MGCKEYELLKDTVKSKAGRVFVYDTEEFVPKDDRDGDNADTFEWFTQNNIENTDDFRPVEEKKLEWVITSEDLQRGIEYAIDISKKDYNEQVILCMNLLAETLRVMKGEK